MLFFYLGGILCYYLFDKSKYIPRVLAVWGILAVSLALIGNMFIIFGLEPSIIMAIPNELFELTIGIWLMLKGIKLYKIES